ncbi:polyhydroxyalkanoate depolymerase [Afifella pfennigii]|uniref:polyhydroxyalkanoate depolymerase n=1 Tax=Afifella pfennigii TaxID=209897 RepID=UPI00047BCD36|nr:polyhydroxyalkanoate depolymerase [Afifella pfennigii]
MAIYQLYELNHAFLAPWRAMADITRLTFQSPFNPMAETPLGRTVAASAELFERTTRRYGKPEFGLTETEVDGKKVAVEERVVWSRPFCDLLHFRRDLPKDRPADPKLLIVAPMSGHYATLLRGTVEAMLPGHEVFITDWADARMVPLSKGHFDLDDYIDYVIEMLRHLRSGAHVMAVCQPSVPVLAAAAVMAEDEDPCVPASMTLMGGPIDTRRSPTAVNRLAEEKDIDWFRRHVIMRVPFPHPGFMREVYPGFLQLSGFMGMNLDRHLSAHRDFFQHLVEDDGDSAEKHREFYDEYLAVMDLTAEFYLQTVETVFIRHDLPKGRLLHRGRKVRPERIRHTALLTVEGERDDISGVGQTEAAHDLCTGLPEDMKRHHLQPKVGHYGVFNGSRFRAGIVPVISEFIRAHADENARALNGASEAVRPHPRDDYKARLADALGFSALAADNLPAVTGDLTEIAGLGPRAAQDLNEFGIYQVSQLAEMSGEAIEVLQGELPARAGSSLEGWVRQARRLIGLPAEAKH